MKPEQYISYRFLDSGCPLGSRFHTPLTVKQLRDMVTAALEAMNAAKRDGGRLTCRGSQWRTRLEPGEETGGRTWSVTRASAALVSLERRRLICARFAGAGKEADYQGALRGSPRHSTRRRCCS